MPQTAARKEPPGAEFIQSAALAPTAFQPTTPEVTSTAAAGTAQLEPSARSRRSTSFSPAFAAGSGEDSRSGIIILGLLHLAGPLARHPGRRYRTAGAGAPARRRGRD